ncbi:uncharacterized protein LOC144652478 isoform X2 [Oculina patagonica]
MDNTKNSKVEKSWRARLLLIKIWVFVSFLSISCGSSSVSATPSVPSNCYEVCVCKSTWGNVSSSMEHMTTASMSMTSSSLSTSSDASMSSSSVSLSSDTSATSSSSSGSMSSSSSSVSSSYRACGNAMSTRYSSVSPTSSSSASVSASVSESSTVSLTSSSSASSSSASASSSDSSSVSPTSSSSASVSATSVSESSTVSPTTSSPIPPPSVHTGEFCWLEVECSTSYSVISATPYSHSAGSVSSVPPTQAPETTETDSSMSTTSHDVTATTSTLLTTATSSVVATTTSTLATMSTSSFSTTTTSTLPTATTSSVVTATTSTLPTMSTSSVVTATTSTLSTTSTSSVVTVTTSTIATTSTSSVVTDTTSTLATTSTSSVVTDTTSTLATTSTSSVSIATETSCSGSPDCHDFTVTTATSYDDTTSIMPTDSASLTVSTTEASCPGAPGCHDSTVSTTSHDITTSIAPTTTASLAVTTTETLSSGSQGSRESSTVSTSSTAFVSSIMPTATSSLVVVSSIVYVSAPDVSAVKFSDTAAKILVEFDKEAETVDGDETCDNLFTIETIALLGSNPQCSFSHSQELQIILGGGASITVGDDLVFKDDVIKALGEQYSRFLSGSFEVHQPDNLLIPTPVITGSDTLASCGNLTLSGSHSFGGGGRPLIYEWKLTSPNGGQDVVNIRNVLNGLGPDADRINILGTLFGTGKTYELTLKVANFLRPSEFEEVTHSITKATEPVPALTLSSGIDLNVGEVYVSEELSIKANILVAPCVNDTRVDFSWTVTCIDASAEQKVESSDSFQATKDQVTMRIEQGVLTADVTCTFNVTASMNYDPSVQGTASQVIKALPSPLQTAIVGGDRQIGRESGAIELDAKTLTVDPDQTNEPLNCSWSCEVQGGGDCVSAVDGQSIFASISGCETEVQSNEFSAGKTYVISVDVSKDSRSASSSITLTVVEGNPPAVWVGQSMKVKASDSVTLEGYYTTSTEPTNVVWTSSQVQGFAVVDLSSYTPISVFNPGNTSFVLLTLPEGLLTPGSKYRFKLKVNDGSQEGVASMDVEVRTGPTSGSFSAQPTTVQALDTVTMSAPQWISDADALPLQYAFGVLVEEDVCETFGAPSSDPEREQIMPQGSGPGYILPLCVIVSDAYDSFVIATVNITSSPPDASDLTPDALESLLDDAVEAPLQSGDVDAALGALISIMDTVQDSNTSDELRSNISQITQGVLLQILGSAVIDEDIAFPLLTVLVKTDAKAADNSSTTGQAALTILEGLDDNPIPDNLADNFIKWLADLSEDTIDNDDNMKETVEEALDKLADNMGADLKCGDPAREAYDQRLGSVKVQVSKLESEITSSSMPWAPKFDPGPTLSGQYSAPRQCGGGKICCGVFLKLIQYKEKVIVADESKQSDDIEVVSSQVLGIELRDPITKELIEVQSLSEPLRLSFIVTSVPSGKTVGCVYFDEQERIWVKTGLTAIGPDGDKLVCASSHATFFAPSYDTSETVEGKTSHDYTPAIVGTVLGFLFGILAVLLIFGILWWRKRQKIKGEYPLDMYDQRL